MRALVVDDSRATRMILREMLEDLGFDVAEATDGNEAIELLDSVGPFDFVMVDWNMAGMGGYEFVQTVRAREHLSDLRLLMISCETDMDHVRLSLEAGADEYVMKPFTKEIVLGKLRLLGIIES